jgi:hypothetical protein
VQYDHQIDVIITNVIRNQGSLNLNPTKTKIHQYLVETYNPKISPTTVQVHLNKLTIANVIEKSEVKLRNNERPYYLSSYAKRQLEYYGNIQPFKSRRESRDGKKSNIDKELGVEIRENEIVIEENQIIIYLNLLLQAADGSAHLEPAFRILPPGWIDIPVSFKRKNGVTTQDIINHRDVGNGRIFSRIRFTVPMVQKCIDILEKKYGIDTKKHKVRNFNIYNTLEENTTPAGYENDDLIERVEIGRTDGTNDNETGILIKDVNLRCFINNIACLIFIVQDRIKYTWLFKRKPESNSWEFQWHTTFFGRERTLELIERSENTLPSLKNKRTKQKLTDYIRKNIENSWSGMGRSDIDHALIESNVRHEFETTLHDKKRVDSYIKQTDRRIRRLYHERIKCDRYERIYCDKHDQNARCEKCQWIHNKYEKYCKFAKDILISHKNKSNALIVPLIELIYPLKLRRVHEKSREERIQVSLVK